MDYIRKLVAQELAREQGAGTWGLLRRHVVPWCWWWRWRKRRPISHLHVAFTSASRTRAALVVDETIWRRKCFVQAPLQVVDDDVVEVVDVILIGVNGWGIHPLREVTDVIIVGELKNTQNMLTNQAWLMNKYHFHRFTLLVGSARSDDCSCPSPRRLASRNAHRVNMLATTPVC
jgi:hypothetical protein